MNLFRITFPFWMGHLAALGSPRACPPSCRCEVNFVAAKSFCSRAPCSHPTHSSTLSDASVAVPSALPTVAVLLVALVAAHLILSWLSRTLNLLPLQQEQHIPLLLPSSVRLPSPLPH